MRRRPQRSPCVACDAEDCDGRGGDPGAEPARNDCAVFLRWQANQLAEAQAYSKNKGDRSRIYAQLTKVRERLTRLRQRRQSL